ncbi:MAG: M48 family metalloprotease [Acidimicrobiales bacterium]|nr:M48 family metalloprotease [Acidimicrobiales bacterium]
MPESAPSSDASLVRLVVLHVAIVALPIMVLPLALRWWLLALPLALLVGVAVTAVRVRGLDERIASTLGARPVDAADVPRLAGLSETVAMAAGVAPPKLHVIDSPSVNAVVWGVGNGPCSLAVTSGLLDTADPVALEAVVGHHLARAQSRSIDVTTLAAALFGPFAKGPFTDGVVSLVQGDEERSVVMADLDGVRATRYPPGMVDVLEVVRNHDSRLDVVPPAMAGLCFAAPGDGSGPFAVHPPVDDRIDLLREI